MKIKEKYKRIIHFWKSLWVKVNIFIFLNKLRFLILNLFFNYFFSTKGAYGEVRKAIHKQSGATRAVKIINKNDIPEEELEKL